METAQTADYALLALLELERQDGRSIAELADALGLSRSVAQRVIVTLHRRAMIVRDQAGRYHLGPELIALGRNVPHELALASAAQLRELSELAGETVVLACALGEQAQVVASRRGMTGPLRIEYETGFRHSLADGASGLAILAFGPAELAERLAPGRTAELDEVRQKGYAATAGQIRVDMAGLAVPVFSDGELLGSLAIIAPAGRLERALTRLDALRAAAESIGRAFARQNNAPAPSGTRRRTN